MAHPLQCRCGGLRGELAQPQLANHVICYCKDCQAFAHALGRPGEVLDAQGGSEVIQTLPAYVTFSQGAERLACLRLSEKGLLRWYAACCDTPIGNTLDRPQLSFVGLVHSCLHAPAAPLGSDIPPLGTAVFTATARGEPKPKSYGMGRSMRWMLAAILKARLGGLWRKTPFFDVRSGRPIADPRVLSAEDRARVYAEVEAAQAGPTAQPQAA